jgi:hypothetical protein
VLRGVHSRGRAGGARRSAEGVTALGSDTSEYRARCPESDSGRADRPMCTSCNCPDPFNGAQVWSGHLSGGGPRGTSTFR